MYDSFDDVVGSIEADRRLKKAATKRSTHGRHYFSCVTIAKAEQNLEETLAKDHMLTRSTLEHFIENCERYPAFKEKMLSRVQEHCRKHPRTRQSISQRLQERILSMA